MKWIMICTVGIKLLTYPWGDKVSMLTYTYPHKLLRKIEVAICNHQADDPFLLVAWCPICNFQIEKVYGHTWHWMSLPRPGVNKQLKLKLLIMENAPVHGKIIVVLYNTRLTVHCTWVWCVIWQFVTLGKSMVAFHNTECHWDQVSLA